MWVVFARFLSAVHLQMFFVLLSAVCIFILTVTMMTVGKSLRGCMGDGGGVGPVGIYWV